MGNGCITEVEHTPHNQEVVGSYPSSQMCILKLVPRGAATLINLPEK